MRRGKQIPSQTHAIRNTRKSPWASTDHKVALAAAPRHQAGLGMTVSVTIRVRHLAPPPRQQAGYPGAGVPHAGRARPLQGWQRALPPCIVPILEGSAREWEAGHDKLATWIQIWTSVACKCGEKQVLNNKPSIAEIYQLPRQVNNTSHGTMERRSIPRDRHATSPQPFLHPLPIIPKPQRSPEHHPTPNPQPSP